MIFSLSLPSFLTDGLGFIFFIGAGGKSPYYL